MKKLLLLLVLLSLSVFPAFAYTEEEAEIFSQQAYQRALDAAKNDDIELASMYFVNALSFSPGDIKIISDYVSLILKRAKAESSISNETLNALDNFLNAQIMTVKPDNLPKIIELRAKVSDVREKILQYMAKNSEPSLDRKKIDSELEKYSNAAENSKNLEDYITALQSAQNFMNEHDVVDIEISENLQAATMLVSLVQKVDELIANSKIKGLEPMQTYNLQLAESYFQQVTLLSASMPLDIRKNLLTLKTAIEQRVNEISEERSATILKEIKNSYDALLKELSNISKRQDQIEKLNDFLQVNSVTAQSITSVKYGSELKNIVSNVQELTLNCRNEQEISYSKWALQQLKDMMAEADKFDRALYKLQFKDYDSMCNVMITHLSIIDTRLLNFGAQRCFSKVYEEYYQKLDSEHQQKLDEAMAYNKKKELREF